MLVTYSPEQRINGISPQFRMSSKKLEIKQASGKPKSWAKDKPHTSKTHPNHQGVSILRYVEGKESPRYLT